MTYEIRLATGKHFNETDNPLTACCQWVKAQSKTEARIVVSGSFYAAVTLFKTIALDKGYILIQCKKYGLKMSGEDELVCAIMQAVILDNIPAKYQLYEAAEDN